MRTETIVLNAKRNVTLTAYVQEVGGEFEYIARRPAILVLPGGGYQMCSDREADPVAFPYLKAGYQVFILRYSVKQDALWPHPLEDYEQAMALIRGNADEWMLYPDKVAVIGFSAGGHLACAAATMSENRPNAAILGYAVTGTDVRACLPSAPDTVAAVDERTCPCFLFATRTDGVVPIDNSIRFMEALAENDIAFECHIYSYGPHGFSTCDPSVQHPDTKISARAPHWVEDSIGWLRELFGTFSDGRMSEPACRPCVNGNHEPYLSLDCTVGRIMRVPAGRELAEDILDGFLQGGGDGAAAADGGVAGEGADGADGGPAGEGEDGADGVAGAEEMRKAARKLTMRDVLAYLGADAETRERIGKQLERIPNRIPAK